MVRPRIVSISVVALVLSGCAGMSQNECRFANWRAVGYEDGVGGQTAQSFAKRRQACAEHGVVANFDAYQDGRRDGLNEYCRPTRGFTEGRRGAGYQGVCPAALEGDFLASYRDGRTLYEIESDVRALMRQINHHTARVDDIDDELADIATSMLLDETSPEQRVDMLNRTRRLAKERVALKNDIEVLEHDLVIRRDELAEREARIAASRAAQ